MSASDGVVKELEALYQQLVEAPQDRALRHRFADALAKAGHAGHAIREYQALAGVYAVEGQLLQAMTLCKVILQLDPDHVETQRVLSELYARREGAEQWTATLPASMSGLVSQWPQSENGVVQASFQPREPSGEALLHSSVGTTEIPSVVGEALDDSIELDIETVESSDVLVLSELIPRFPLFTEVGRKGFVALFETLELRSHLPGEVILQEGAPGESMFAIAEGVVEVYRRRDDGTEDVLSRLEQGAFFGEMALVSQGPRLASVRAVGPTVLLEFSREDLMALVKSHPSVGRVLARFYRARLLANLMRASPIFRPLGAAEKQALATQCKLRTVEAGTELLKEGATGDGIQLILRGRCSVSGTRADGSPMEYPELREGEVFGEISALLDRPATATVRALTDCTLLRVSRRALEELVAPNTQVREMITRLGEERLQRTADLLPQGYWVTDHVLV